MKTYIVYYRPRKNLSQFVVSHHVLVSNSYKAEADSKQTIRRRFKVSTLNRLYVIEEVIEV